MTPPQRGHMRLYDAMLPALRSGRYTVSVDTEVSGAGVATPIDGVERYFDVRTPPLRMPATEVAGTYPPSGATGAFHETLPMVVLSSHTLPWERDPALAGAGDDTPWLALLLFEEDECEVVDTTLADPLLGPARTHLLATDDPPATDETLAAVDASESLVKAILPARDELRLLTHVREVNVEDRELAAGDSDGWFAVVAANRLPERDKRYRACLVSIEARGDLVPPVPPPAMPSPARPGKKRPAVHVATRRLELAVPGSVLAQLAVEGFEPGLVIGGVVHMPPPRARLVCLYSWSFTCEGTGTFEDLMTGLDVGLVGERHPDVTDTGHLPLAAGERDGSSTTVWFRGPLSPVPVARDPLGPYQSADQARRVSPETGREDISYAAAFEVGRLLAAGDGRLAQEVAAWRRGQYRRAARADNLQGLLDRLDIRVLAGLDFEDLIDRLRVVLPPLFAIEALGRIRTGCGPLVDPWGTDLVRDAPGLDPYLLGDAWGMPAEAAGELLGVEVTAGGGFGPGGIDVLDGFTGTLGSIVDRPAVFDQVRDLGEVASDAALLGGLSRLRAGLLENAERFDGGGLP